MLDTRNLLSAIDPIARRMFAALRALPLQAISRQLSAVSSEPTSSIQHPASAQQALQQVPPPHKKDRFMPQDTWLFNTNQLASFEQARNIRDFFMASNYFSSVRILPEQPD